MLIKQFDYNCAYPLYLNMYNNNNNNSNNNSVV